MEFVALSDTVLNILAREDASLRISFRGVFPGDKLPSVPRGDVLLMPILSTRIQREDRVNIG